MQWRDARDEGMLVATTASQAAFAVAMPRVDEKADELRRRP
jgi:hypothetical protein